MWSHIACVTLCHILTPIAPAKIVKAKLFREVQNIDIEHLLIYRAVFFAHAHTESTDGHSQLVITNEEERLVSTDENTSLAANDKETFSTLAANDQVSSLHTSKESHVTIANDEERLLTNTNDGESLAIANNDPERLPTHQGSKDSLDTTDEERAGTCMDRMIAMQGRSYHVGR